MSGRCNILDLLLILLVSILFDLAKTLGFLFHPLLGSKFSKRITSLFVTSRHTNFSPFLEDYYFRYLRLLHIYIYNLCLLGYFNLLYSPFILAYPLLESFLVIYLLWVRMADFILN